MYRPSSRAYACLGALTHGDDAARYPLDPRLLRELRNQCLVWFREEIVVGEHAAHKVSILSLSTQGTAVYAAERARRTCPCVAHTGYASRHDLRAEAFSGPVVCAMGAEIAVFGRPEGTRSP